MYVGRFAPSPTGPLHAGSLVAALASWLDARAHGGKWLVRIEDVDTPRCVSGADRIILQQLAACGLVSDEAPVWQSQRAHHYQAALDQLGIAGRAYPCACSRKDVEQSQIARGIARQRGAELPYPGTCRPERGGLRGQAARAWRLHTGRQHIQSESPTDSASAGTNEEAHTAVVDWHDRRLGHQRQNVEQEVGDFILRRADGLWAYQLAVVVDDAAQGVTHIVRGEDLADNTPRQILLQRALGVATPSYLHTPLVLAADGQKLSKQTGAAPLDTEVPSHALGRAAVALGLPAADSNSVADLLNIWVGAWKDNQASRTWHQHPG